ncbi:hypothetical protein Xph01_27640 [Micromonospora phaseoli]|nr:hypothetical protein Xph01_27640 [Micromonospora phaseoli]
MAAAAGSAVAGVAVAGVAVASSVTRNTERIMTGRSVLIALPGFVREKPRSHPPAARTISNQGY